MKKGRLGIVIALATIILLLLNCKIYNSKSLNDTSIEINNLIEATINREIEDYSEESRNKLKLKLKTILNASNKKDLLVKSKIILANIYIEEKNNEEAEKYLDEVIKDIGVYNNDRVKGLTYFSMSRLYLYSKMYDKSEEMFIKMKEVCENKERELIVIFSNIIGIDLLNTPGGKEKSIKAFENAAKIAKEINYDKIEDIYLKLGIAYWYSDRFVESINTKLEALKIAQSKGLDEMVARIYTDIGVDYLYTKEYKESVSYLLKGLSHTTNKKGKDERAKLYVLLNLCEAYTRIGEFESAKKQLDLLDETINSQKSGAIKEDYLTFMYLNKADLESEMGNPREALDLIDLAKSRYEKRVQFSFLHFNVELMEEYGDAYYKLKDYNKAVKYHKEVERLIKESKITYLEEEIYEKIYKDYKALNDNKNAIKYLEKSFDKRKESSENKSNQYAQYLANQFESAKQEEEISKLNKTKNNVIIVVLLLSIVIFIILLFTYTIYRKNKKINRLNKLFKELSITDSITKLQNRRFLDEYLDKNWHLFKKSNMMISFMMIDIDYFKKYNDNYGHLEGDKALISVASDIKNACRKSDFAARYGGEEFIVIMINTDKDEAISLAEKIKESIYNRNIKHEYSSISDRVTVSIGIYSANICDVDAYSEYIKKADEALYKSKEKGRNTYTSLSKII